MKKTLSKIISSAIIFTAIFSYPVSAEEKKEASQSKKPAISQQITPVSQHVILRKNEKYEDNFKIKNNGIQDANFIIYATPFTVAGEDYQMSFSHENSRTQLSRWLSFRQGDGNFGTKITVPVKSGEEKQVIYRISSPADIPDGGQYALIVAESDGSGSKPDKNGFRIIPRLTLSLYGRSEGGTRYKTEIIQPKVSGFLVNKDITASALINNDGNADIDSEAKLEIYTVFGKNVYSSTRSQKIFPEQPFRFKIASEKIRPFFGIYRAEFSVKAFDKNIKKTVIVLSMNTFCMILSIILLTALLAFAIIKIKQRKERRARQMI